MVYNKKLGVIETFLFTEKQCV